MSLMQFGRDNTACENEVIMSGAWGLPLHGENGCGETGVLKGVEHPSQVLDWRTGWILE